MTCSSKIGFRLAFHSSCKFFSFSVQSYTGGLRVTGRQEKGRDGSQEGREGQERGVLEFFVFFVFF